mgnify:CR=1 FL=1|tara:strand:- start:153 stop:503 length:351 start_codon:yes stop_codon:yes gene_type:complete
MLYFIYPIIISPFIALWLNDWVFKFTFEYSHAFLYLITTILGMAIIHSFKEVDYGYVLKEGFPEKPDKKEYRTVQNNNGTLLEIDEKGRVTKVFDKEKGEWRDPIKNSWESGESPF